MDLALEEMELLATGHPSLRVIVPLADLRAQNLPRRMSDGQSGS
jgi:hypothetical protein